MSRRVAILVLAWSLTGHVPCVLGGDTPQTTSAPEQRIESGPIRVTLRLDRSRLNVAQSVRATLTIEAPADVQIELSSAPDHLGEFKVVSVKDPPPEMRTEAGKLSQLWQRILTLEPFLPGTYTIPELEVRWKIPGANQAGLARTTPVKVEVVSLAPDPTDPKQPPDTGSIREAYTLPSPSKKSLVPALIGAFVAVGAGLGAGWWLRSRVSAVPDVAGAAALELEKLAGGISSSASPNEQHAAAGAIRRALGDIAGPGLASASAEELPAKLAGRADSSDAHVLARVLGTLDTKRFAGDSIPGSEFASLVREASAVINRMRATQLSGRAA